MWAVTHNKFELCHNTTPDRLPKAHRNPLRGIEESKSKILKAPVVLIGKSKGSRVGCHLTLQEKDLTVICLGYPSCGQGDRLKLRDPSPGRLGNTSSSYLRRDRDPLCPLDLLGLVRKQMKATNELYVVHGGNHSLKISRTVLKGASEAQDEVEQRILVVIETFLSRLKR